MKFPELPIGAGMGYDTDAVTFHNSEAAFGSLPEVKLAGWLMDEARTRGFTIHSLTYVACSDDELHTINVQHLEHDTLTDIITFDLRDEYSTNRTFGDSKPLTSISGECYLSLDRIEDNASLFGVSRESELYRVLVHGLLHLCGLSDKTDADQQVMRAAEDAALARLKD